MGIFKPNKKKKKKEKYKIYCTNVLKIVKQTEPNNNLAWDLLNMDDCVESG